MLLRNSLPDTPSPVARSRRSTESVLSAADTSLGQSENPSDSESPVPKPRLPFIGVTPTTPPKVQSALAIRRPAPPKQRPSGPLFLLAAAFGGVAEEVSAAALAHARTELAFEHRLSAQLQADAETLEGHLKEVLHFQAEATRGETARAVAATVIAAVARGHLRRTRSRVGAAEAQAHALLASFGRGAPPSPDVSGGSSPQRVIGPGCRLPSAPASDASTRAVATAV